MSEILHLSPETGEVGGKQPANGNLVPLITLLEDQEVYALDSPITEHVRDRVRVLCGDEYQMPEVIVIKDPNINAAACLDTIVVSDGIFDKLTYNEERDGVLAHELIHLARGHTCDRQSTIKARTLTKLWGIGRSHEVEADILGMQLLDKKGINPLGMVSVARKLAVQDAELLEEKRKRFKYASVVHGDSLERGITLEQALTVVDARHLGPELHPMTERPQDDLMSYDDERCAATPLAVQQALLNTELKRTPVITDAHVEKQAKILQAVSEEVIAEETLQRQARLMLDLESTVLPLTAPNIEQLEVDLQLLTTPSAQMLMGRRSLVMLKYQRAKEYVYAAMRDIVNGADHIKTIADICKRYASEDVGSTAAERLANPTNLVADVLDESFLSSLDREQCAAVPEKLAIFAVNWGINYGDVQAGIDTLITHKVSVAGMNAAEFGTALMTHINAELSKGYRTKQTTMERLEYFATRPRSLEDDSFTEWGKSNWAFQNKGNKVAEIEGELYLQLKNEVHRLGISEVVGHTQQWADTVHDPDLVKRVASVINTIFMRAEALPPVLTKQEWMNYLPIKLARFNYDVDMKELIDRDNWDEFFRELEGEPPRTITYQTNEVIKIVSIVRKEIERLSEQHPNILPMSGPHLIEILQNIDTYKHALFHKALKQAAIGRYDGLTTLLTRQPIDRLSSNTFYVGSEALQEATSLWTKATETFLKREDWESDETKLLAFAALGMASQDVEINLNAPKFAFEKITRGRDFAGGLELLETYNHIRAVHPTILRVLIEEKAQSAEEFERLNTLIENLYIETILENAGKLGVGAVADSIAIPFYSEVGTTERKVGIKVDVVKGLENSKLLGALLSTAHDDSALKEYLARRWWFVQRTTQGDILDSSVPAAAIREHFTVEDYLVYRFPNKKALLKHWLDNDYPRAGAYKPFDTNLSSAYLLTDAVRFFAVRKLLLSRGKGVLMHEQGTTELVEALMSSWLAGEEGENGVVLHDLLLDLVTKNDPATTYLHIGPMLQDMILKPPKQPTDLVKVTRAIANDAVDGLVRRGQMPVATEADYEAVHTRVRRLFAGNSAEKKPQSDIRYEKAVTQFLTMTGAVDIEAASNKLSTIGFAAVAGKKSGSLGVKMLQLAGQYFDLSADDEKEFEGIYDDMVGQTRLQAYNVLKREGQYNSSVNELLGSITRFGKRIGGGSLFTVYEAELQDGRRLAIGVKNPNAEYRIARLAEFASTGLEGTTAKHPGNTTLQLMASLLDDAVTWVRDELDDPEFPHKDRIFKQENDTLAGTETGFKKHNSRYDLTTPEAIYTGSQWVRSEALIEGKNLTGLRISDDQPTDVPSGTISREDFKHAASVITRNYVHQIMRGQFAHSDIHPGNFRITDDNSQVVIFDRHNLIPMHPQLRQTLRAAFGSIMVNDLSGAALAVASHAAPPEVDRDHLRRNIEETIAQAADPSHIVTDTLLMLKREGIKVPLDLSLLLRNFMSVSKLSTQAGFANVLESFLHTSSGFDELAQMANDS